VVSFMPWGVGDILPKQLEGDCIYQYHSVFYCSQKSSTYWSITFFKIDAVSCPVSGFIF